MASQCPHCNNEVILGGIPTPKPVPRPGKTAARGSAAKIVAWISTLLVIVLAAILGVTLNSRSRDTAASTSAGQSNAPNIFTGEKSPAVLDAEDAAKYHDAIEKADFGSLFQLQKQLAATTDAAAALKICYEAAGYYEAIETTLVRTRPSRREVQLINQQVVDLFRQEKLRNDSLIGAIQGRAANKYTPLLRDGSIHQVEWEQKLSQVAERLDLLLDKANHPASKANRLKRIACIENVKAILLAQQEWALKNNRSDDAVATEQDLLPFLKGNEMPKCPDDGKYIIGSVTRLPRCSAAGHSNNQTVQ